MPERYQYPVDNQPVAGLLKLVADNGFVLHLLRNEAGLLAAVTNCGGRLVSLLVPDSNGKKIEVIEGFGSFNDKPAARFKYDAYLQYLKNRVGNLFEDNKISKTIILAAHQTDNNTLELTYSADDADSNALIPAKIKLVYVLTADNRLKIIYEVTPAIINGLSLTGGISFNLNGAGTESFSGHFLQINADNYLPVDGNLVPTGKIENVSGTPFDFRKTAAICARINDNNEQLRNGKGFNHFYVLNKHSGRTPVARAKGDKTGIIMELCTEAPGLQFYCSSTPHDKRDRDGSQDGFSLDVHPVPAFKGSDIPESSGFETNQSYRTVAIYRFKNQ